MWGGSVVTILVLTNASAAWSWHGAVPDGVSLPSYDARLVDDARKPHVTAAINEARKAIGPERREAAIKDLKQAVRGVRIEDNGLFGTPHFVGSTLRLLTAPRDLAQPGTVNAIVKDFIRDQQTLFEIAAEEIDGARIHRNYITQHNSVRHLTYQQQIDGVDLFGCEVRANVTSDGELINISSTMLPRPAGGFVVPAPVISAQDAIALAAADIGILLTETPQPLDIEAEIGTGRLRAKLTDAEIARFSVETLQTIQRGMIAPNFGMPRFAGPASQRQAWTPTADFRQDELIHTELVYFPLTRHQIHPAWSLVLPEKGIGNTYEMIVDAVTGEVLRRWNRLHFGGTENITFRVYTSDSPQPGSPGLDVPDTTQFPVVPRELIVIEPGDVAAYSPNGWINDGDTETIGNNVAAHTDIDGNNAPDLPRPNGGPGRVFDFSLDLADEPLTYQDASVTQLFYLCNVYHDRLYALGFDEASGNFQEDNFGMGGFGGDPVQADAQDNFPFSTNNANFATPSDGNSGRMQMFIFDGPTPDIDGSLDSDIVYHEYTHGLSNRLHGSLFGTQPGAMGEGWSDFFALGLNAEPSDDPHATYAMGPYATFDLLDLMANYYFGIRRFPYSTDLNKNPLTFADIDPTQIDLDPGIPITPITAIATQPANEVHNAGEVWCMALLEGRANLWDEIGFPANELMMQLAVDGMKLSPGNPNMLVARDAILQADLVNNGGANLAALWSGFAKRGMGASATSPATSATGLSEAFDVPALLLFSYPGGVPERLDPLVPTTFSATITALGGNDPIPGTGTLFYSNDGGMNFSSAPLVNLGGDDYETTLPAFDCLEDVTFYVSIDSEAGTVTDPIDAPNATYAAGVFLSITELVSLDFEIVDPQWMVSGDASEGHWDQAVPAGGGDRGDPAFDFDGSGQCWLTDSADGNTDVDDGSTLLTSPVFDISALDDPHVGYARWYSNTAGANPEQEVMLIEVSDDGGSSWTTLETVGPTAASPNPEVNGGWFEKTHRLSDFVTPNEQFRIRFIATDTPGNGSIVEAAIDAFELFEFVCSAPCPGADGDIDGDGVLTGNDVRQFVTAVLGTPSGEEVCAGDFNGSAALDSGDIAGLAAALVGP